MKPDDSDKPTARMSVTTLGLIPVDDFSGDLLARYEVGTEVEVTFHQAPSPRLRRLLFAVLHDVVPNTDWPTVDALRRWISVRLGHVSHFRTLRGDVTVEPRSLTELEQPELSEYFANAMLIIGTEIIPGFDVDALVRKRNKTVRRDDA